MSRSYKGQILDTETGAEGHLMFTLRDDGTVSGQLRMGSPPQEANTGFGGIWEGSEITAGGANTTTGATPEDAIKLTVNVTGDILASGNIAGTINYTWNFTPGSWAFNAKQVGETQEAYEGTAGERAGMSREELLAAQKKEAEAKKEEEDMPGYWGKVKKYWDKTPTWAKVGGGVVLAEGLRRMWSRK